MSVKERQDGPRPDNVSRIGRSRGKQSRPLSTTEAQRTAMLFTCRRIHDFAAELEPDHGIGRPLEFNPVIALVMDAVTGRDGRSQRNAILNHTDEVHWPYYYWFTRHAFPNEPHLWLDEQPPSRSQIRRWLETRLSSPETLDRFDELLEDVAVDVSDTIGIGKSNPGDLTHPSLAQGFNGDGTYLRGYYNTSYEDAIDKETGELRTTRFDRDAKKIQQDKGYPGYRMTHVAAHTGYTREDVVYKIDISPGQQGSDAEKFTDMALAVYPRMPGMRTAQYDGAMHGTEIDRFLSAGIIAMNHVQLTRTGDVARFNIGEHTFITRTGSTHTEVVTFVDGPPCVTIATAEGRHEIPLVRGRDKRRKNADGTFTIYGIWAYPDQPIVPAHLRGATTLVRFSSTPEEVANGRRRTRAARAIPPNDPDFPVNYGGRNNTENRHHQLKVALPNKRLNVVGLNRVRRRLISRYLAKNLEAAIAWHERTGGDISHLFTEPPPLAETA